MDRQEVEFIFDHPTRFIDLEGGSSILTEPSVIREEYLKEMQIISEKLKKFVLKIKALIMKLSAIPQ